MQYNQWVRLNIPRKDFHCMEVYTDNGKSGYVIDFCQGLDVPFTRNDLVFVEYDRTKEQWTETGRVAR